MNQIDVGVTAFITNSLGQIVLGRKARACHPSLVGKRVTPGGRVKFKEALLVALHREIKEESGLDVDVEGILCSDEIIYDNIHIVIFSYVAQVKDDNQPIVSGDDLEDVRWFDIQEVKLMWDQLTPVTQRTVEAALNDWPT